MTLAEGDRHKQIEHMLGECESSLNSLSPWECGFIESVRDQFDRSGTLSTNQTEKLEQIYCKCS